MVEHYYSEKQTSPFNKKKISFVFKNKKFTFYTAPGVFSKTRVDPGTRFLLENMIINDSWRVLDLGCGYGVVGIVIKKLFPNTNVVMSDVNERALKLARLNAKLNNVSVEIIKSDSFNNINGFFNAILINPPQAAGLKTCYKLIIDSEKHLLNNGLLELVARPKKGGSRFEQKLLEVFGNVETIRGKTYWVYVSKKLDKTKGLVRKIMDNIVST